MQESNHWADISAFFPSYNSDKCKFKWLSLQKSQSIEQPWTEIEDELLFSLL